MATETRTTAIALEEALLAHGERFSYFQAMRLLRLFGKVHGFAEDSLRVRPKLGLGFPESDIDSIELRPEGGYRVTANFFGLYGVASPLPTYYTEDLFEEQREGRHATRDFLDVVHHAMYPLLYDAWRKYRVQLRVIEDHDHSLLDHLFSFVGLDDRALRDSLPFSGELLRYAGLFNLRPRSASGLQTLLADAFSPAQVEIDSCTLRALPIPLDQRLRLGTQANRLGEDTYLGCEIDDYSSSLTIRLGELPEELFHMLLPGTQGHERLRFLTRYYLIDPLDVRVELGLRRMETQSARFHSGDQQLVGPEGLGTTPGDWSRLGLNTWLNPEFESASTRVTFML